MNKETLLNKVSEVQIYEKFCTEYNTKKNVKSPFSEDKNPSFRFYDNNTFKCFSTGKQGDVFQFVADLNDIDCKQNFDKVLHIISEAFSVDGRPKRTTKKVLKTEPKKEIEKVDTSKHFSFETKEFDKNHLEYFLKDNWNVTEDILKEYKVSALDKFQYWNEKKNEVTKIKLFKNVFGFVYNVNNRAEIYIPTQEKAKKFFHNRLEGADIFGLEQLSKYDKKDFLIVCAGKKDCLILNANGFPAVSFRSENHTIIKEQIRTLKLFSKNILVCYDNDMSGMSASVRVAEQHNLIELILPQEFNDVADYFKEKTKGDLKILINDAINLAKEQETEEDNKLEQGSTIFHLVESYLSKNYTFRFNTVLLDIEYKCKSGRFDWIICNEFSLYVEMQKKSINIQMNKLIAILRSDFVPHYNPIKSYFSSLKKWDGKDYIKELVSYVKTPNEEQLLYNFKKWLVRSVKCLLIDGYFNKQAFVLTDKGVGQDIGKSHFTKWLVPKELTSTRSFEDSKKDNLVKLATNAFIILDELDGISRKDLNNLKSLFSTDEIRARLPYDKRDRTIQRTANFLGSTNEETFLTDPTGSVRWLVFHVIKINWDYSKKIEVDNIWAQAYALAKDVNFNEKFTKQDLKQNEIRNQAYQIRTPEVELLSLLFEPANEKNRHKAIFMTATEIKIYLQNNSTLKGLNTVSVGKALTLLKYERAKGKGVYGYKVVRTGKSLFQDDFLEN